MLDQKRLERIASEIAKILRQERTKNGLSINRVAERAGLSPPMVSYVERGMRIPTIDSLLRMSEALGLNLAEVIERAQRAVMTSRTK